MEVGLPMGPELLKSITDLTHITFDYSRQKSGDEMILQALKLFLNEGREVQKLNDHLKAAWQLGESSKQALSIDNVIEALEDPRVELVGKLGIIRAILKAESSSTFFRKPENQFDGIDVKKFEDTWYSSFTKLLTENVKKSDVSQIFNNLEIINFNYDRCLEHYLPFSIAGYYGIPIEEARDAMKRLVVHRPYGMAGKLDWQQVKGPSIGFGSCSAQQISEAAQQIRTFTERVDEGVELRAMRDSVARADRIVFLGFAFHRQNVELIAQRVQSHTEIVATAYKISASDKAVIATELENSLEMDRRNSDGRLQLVDMECRQFFKEYWRTLTADRRFTAEPTLMVLG